jgi:hypothetical protein
MPLDMAREFSNQRAENCRVEKIQPLDGRASSTPAANPGSPKTDPP